MLVMTLVLLPGLVAQPEVVADAQADGSQRDTRNQRDAPPLLLAALRGVLRGAFGASGGSFG